jgi:hypothetical protein
MDIPLILERLNSAVEEYNTFSAQCFATYKTGDKCTNKNHGKESNYCGMHRCKHITTTTTDGVAKQVRCGRKSVAKYSCGKH